MLSNVASINEQYLDINDKEDRLQPHLVAPLILALNRSYTDVYKNLWGEELINIYSVRDLHEVTGAIANYEQDNLIEYHLSSPVSINLFFRLSIGERI